MTNTVYNKHDTPMNMPMNVSFITNMSSEVFSHGILTVTTINVKYWAHLFASRIIFDQFIYSKKKILKNYCKTVKITGAIENFGRRLLLYQHIENKINILCNKSFYPYYSEMAERLMILERCLHSCEYLPLHFLDNLFFKQNLNYLCTYWNLTSFQSLSFVALQFLTNTLNNPRKSTTKIRKKVKLCLLHQWLCIVN